MRWLLTLLLLLAFATAAEAQDSGDESTPPTSDSPSPQTPDSDDEPPPPTSAEPALETPNPGEEPAPPASPAPTDPAPGAGASEPAPPGAGASEPTPPPPAAAPSPTLDRPGRRARPSPEKADALATYVARRLQRGMFFGSVETWGTGLLFWHGAGAGPLRRKRLLEDFGSVEAIRTAAPEVVADAARYKGTDPHRLHRVEFLQMQIGKPARGGVVVPSSWNVLDGYGAPMSPRTLALRVGDFELLERIDLEAETMFAVTVGAAIATAALLTVGTMELRATASAFSYPTPPPPVLAHQAAVRRRGGVALIVLGAAISTAAASAATTTAVMHTKLVTFWTEDDLDRVIQRYNEELQEDLGLTADEVGRYVRRRGVAPRVMPMPTGIVGEF